MPNHKQKLGHWGEELAAQYYIKLGWRIVARNYRTRWGELDLILIKNQDILLVEVKTRNKCYLHWEETCVTANKINKLALAWQQFLQDYQAYKTCLSCNMEVCLIELGFRQIKIQRFKLDQILTI